MTARSFTLRLSVFNAFLFLGSGVQLPFLPLWLKGRGMSPAEIGIVVAAMTAIRILAIPAGAYAADTYGYRKRIIIAASGGAFLCFLALAFMPGFWTILAAAVLAAALFAPVGPLAEVLAIEGSGVLGSDYGRIRLWASLSFLTGNLLSGALLEVMPVAGVIYLLAAAQGLGAVAALILPEDPGPVASEMEPVPPGRMLVFLASSGFLVFILGVSIAQASHGFLYAFGSVHWDHLGYGKFTIGGLWAAGVLTEVTMFAFARHFHARWGAVRLIVIGAGCGLVRWCILGFDPPLWLLIPAQMLHAGSFGLTHLGTMHHIHETVPAGMRNTVQGVYAALSGGILMSASMWASGPLYGALGGWSYFAMAALSALALAFATGLARLSPRGSGAAAS